MTRPGRAAALAVLVAMAGGAHAAPPTTTTTTTIVWPRRPDVDVTGADDAVRRAGATPIAFAPVRARLVEQGARATAAEAAALDAIAAALAAARDAYLKQDFAQMADRLAAAEAAHLAVLAEPRQLATLWELEVQRGLAELARGAAAPAGARFAFALALDEARAPRRELYGPAVARAFTDAVDARAATPPRPVALHVMPTDARIAIDGLAVIDNAAPRALRPGLHAVTARAPGYAPFAAVIELRAPGTGSSAGAGTGSSASASAGHGSSASAGHGARAGAGSSAGAGTGSSAGAGTGSSAGAGTGSSASAGTGSSAGASTGSSAGAGAGSSAGLAITVALTPAPGDAIARLGDTWSAGELDADTASGRAAIAAAAAAAGASVALVIDRDPARGDVVVRTVAGDAPATIDRAATPALAVTAALDHTTSHVTAPLAAAPPPARSVLRSPWLWAGVAAATAAAIVTTVVLIPHDHTIRVLPPD